MKIIRMCSSVKLRLFPTWLENKSLEMQKDSKWKKRLGNREEREQALEVSMWSRKAGSRSRWKILGNW